MSPDNPRTITIFLTTGNPNGIKKLEVSNRTIRAYVMPRALVAEARKLNELTQPALYLLFDKDDLRAYIGESENFYERIKNHDQSKEFWETAVAFIAKDKSLEKGDIKYLESLAVEKSIKANRMEIENKTVPPRNNLYEFKIPTVNEFFEDVKLLTSTLGHPLFDKVQTESVSDEDLWYCRAKNTEAKGIYNEQGFTVVAGSTINAIPTPGFAKNFPKEAADREAMLLTSAKRISDISYETTVDLTFGSVSRASGFCTGRASNGWLEWKNSMGKTMDEIMRKSHE